MSQNNVLNSTCPALSLPFGFNLGFGSYKHVLLSTDPCSDATVAHAGADSASEHQKKGVGFHHHLLFALCFPRLEGFLSITIDR